MNRKIEKYVKSTNEGGGFDVRVSDSTLFLTPNTILARHQKHVLSHG